MAATKLSGVRIDSGLDPLNRLESVPPGKWEELVGARRWYISVQFMKDCSKLVEWVGDAEALAGPLGYASADDLIARGYGLEPEEVRLAVRWLELNDPDAALGLPEVVTKAQQLAADPDVEPLAGHGGKRGQGSNTTLPDRGAAYLVRRLKRDHKDIAEALARGEYKSARAAGIAAGIVKVPTPYEEAKKVWKKMTKAQRRNFRKWMEEQP